MTTVNFYDPSFIPDGKLTYSVISARFRGRWIFVKHRQRKSFEIPGGHIEDNETPDEAARRELTEETGAILFDIACIATYSVEKEGYTGYGRLFFAEVSEIGDIRDTSEIDQVIFGNELPGELTYPDIQPKLFEEVIRYTQTRLS
jgi:8-oxo-dGTP diphosphatase